MNKLIICVFSLTVLAGSVQAQDPTKPEWRPTQDSSSAARAAAPALKLQLIRSQTTQPLAVINGQTYKVGATVGDYRVVHIGASSVTLRRDTETLVLHLFVKTRP